MYKNNFIVSIIANGSPVKEFDGKISLPFHTEYSIRLKNKHDRRCTAQVLVDGRNATALGDIIIPARGSVTLDRFITESLTSGRRFRFVPLSHPEVDDPGDVENGVIQVDFRLERTAWITINNNWPQPWFPFKPGLRGTSAGETDSRFYPSYSATVGSDVIKNIPAETFSCNYIKSNVSEDGATIGGSISGQSFTQAHIEVENWGTQIRVKLVSSKDLNSREHNVGYSPRYCARCGRRRREGDIYCSSCGKKY